MAKRVVPRDRKLQAVMDVTSGNLSLEERAAKHNVSLAALYAWRNVFFENVEQLFQPRKPGPKSQTPSLELVDFLTTIIQVQSAEINRLQKKMAQENAVNDDDNSLPKSGSGHLFPQVGVEWFACRGKTLSLSFGKFLLLGVKLLAAPLLRVWGCRCVNCKPVANGFFTTVFLCVSLLNISTALVNAPPSSLACGTAWRGGRQGRHRRLKHIAAEDGAPAPVRRDVH